MRIVPGDLSRIDELEPLFTAMHEHHRSGGDQVLPFRSSEEAWERRRRHYVALLESGRGHLLLAEEDGRAIGYAMVSVGGGQATLATGERMAELETLSVAEGERGRGVGEVMLYVLDGNDGAIRFYERRGMRPYLHVMLGRVPAAGAD